MKTQKKVVVKGGKVVKSTIIKVKLPTQPWSRLQVLLAGFDSKSIKFDTKYTLATMKIGKDKYADLISSKPAIGRTTRKGLRAAGIECEAVKEDKAGKIEVVIFHKVK